MCIRDSYTLTSASGGKDSAPKNFTLYLSNDGSTWTEADKRENVTFEWSLYTKPFKTNAADYVQYRYVRLDIKSDSEIQLGELELMSTEMPAPVSYTHLDVYKRQALCRPGQKRRCSGP